jgi:hypothetical protein
VLTNAIAATALTLAATMGSPAAAPLEDEAGFNCATQGNHICGPGGEAPAGLYRDGQLIQPWTNYDNVEADPLYGVTPGTEYDNIAEQVAALHQGCWIEHKVDGSSEFLAGDLALMPADATEVPCDQVDEALEAGQEAPPIRIEYGTVDELAWQEFLARGYRGDPADHKEALYVPADVYAEVTGEVIYEDDERVSLEYPMDDLAAERPVEYYGGTPGGAVCSTDAACSAYTRDKGGEYGYGASPEKAVLWDGIPA